MYSLEFASTRNGHALFAVLVVAIWLSFRVDEPLNFYYNFSVLSYYLFFCNLCALLRNLSLLFTSVPDTRYTPSTHPHRTNKQEGFRSSLGGVCWDEVFRPHPHPSFPFNRTTQSLHHPIPISLVHGTYPTTTTTLLNCYFTRPRRQTQFFWRTHNNFFCGGHCCERKTQWRWMENSIDHRI